MSIKNFFFGTLLLVSFCNNYASDTSEKFRFQAVVGSCGIKANNLQLFISTLKTHIMNIPANDLVWININGQQGRTEANNVAQTVNAPNLDFSQKELHLVSLITTRR